MKSLVGSFCIAAVLLSLVGGFALSAQEGGYLLLRVSVGLIVSTSIACLLLLLPASKTTATRSFSVGALLPVACLAFGNSETFDLIGEMVFQIPHVLLGLVCLAGEIDEVFKLALGMALFSIASGVLTSLVWSMFMTTGQQTDTDRTAEA